MFMCRGERSTAFLLAVVISIILIPVSVSWAASDAEAKILEVFADKDGHMQGEQVSATVEWRPYGQLVRSRSVAGKGGTNTYPISADMTIVGDDGQLCAEPVATTLFAEDTHISIVAPLLRDCASYEARISLIGSGEVFDTAVFSSGRMENVSSDNPAIAMDKGDSSVDGFRSSMMDSISIKKAGMAVIGGLSFIGIIVISYRSFCHRPKKQRRVRGMIKTLLLPAVFVGSIAAFPAAVSAAPGVCGAAAGSASASVPSANLCSAGNPSHVYEYGFWWWQCAGTDGDMNATCYADKSVPAPTLTFFSSANQVVSEGSITLRWRTTGAADVCIASGSWSGDKPVNGSETVGNLTADSTFYLSCSGSGGSTRAQTVTVNVVPSIHAVRPEDPSVTGPGFGSTSETVTFSATALDPNDQDVEFKIDWNHDGQFDRADGDEIAGQYAEGGEWVSSGGSKTFSHIWNSEGSYTFGVAARNKSGWWSSDWTEYTVVISDGGAVAVPVTPSLPALSLDFTINNRTGTFTLNRDDPEIMRWVLSNAVEGTVCSASSSDHWFGNQASGNGTHQYSQNATNTSDFTLSCDGPSGHAESMITVHVVCPPRTPAEYDDPCNCDIEQKSHYVWDAISCSYVSDGERECSKDEKNACRDFNWKEVAP